MIASASVARFDGLFRSSERPIHIAGIRTFRTRNGDRAENHISPSALYNVWASSGGKKRQEEAKPTRNGLCSSLKLNRWSRLSPAWMWLRRIDRCGCGIERLWLRENHNPGRGRMAPLGARNLSDGGESPKTPWEPP